MTRLPAYRIPEVPETAWTAAPSARRTWLSRGLLLGILLVQALLALRLRNTAYQDEALYLYAGDIYLNSVLHGTPVTGDYADYFSGSPYFYPVLAAVADHAFGLEGARALSLLFMLGGTALLYSFTCRLFNERTGLFAAGAFAVAESSLVLARYATYDSSAIFLLALATWLVIRGARGSVWWCVLAGPVAALAVAAKYAAGLFMPTVIVLAVLVALPHERVWKALLRGPLLAALIGGCVLGAFEVTGTLEGIRSTTVQRAEGVESVWVIMATSAKYGGIMIAVALLGTVMFTVRGRMGESPTMGSAPLPGRPWRLCLGLLLTGTGLLAPAYQAHLHTWVSLHKHVGYGLLFVAPMAGVGISRLVGAHFRYPQVGIGVWVAMLVMGMAQSQNLYAGWPDSTRLTQVLQQHVTPQGRYLSVVPQIPIYYLGSRTRPEQWQNTYYFEYTTRTGKKVTGDEAYRAAIKARYFDLVVLDYFETPRVDRLVAAELRRGGRYRLLARLPYEISSGPGSYEIWAKQ
ncbi:glycosyltransferase family 39 protein [Planotetraspora sp. A-T 1434]|uniref:ArnT family glycosyltransferase n=1 Tax=Planotetraspora sp. A-T 1434 TaxID=2979219 RepID=UPI0021C23977|nr:glycosyltransferase family 39 protein [Planotetraspora sp. A-T 1434]MCT9933787.1 glycosyltransferase family 39 protein [Planotetraspora sp. A-T 1434]